VKFKVDCLRQFEKKEKLSLGWAKKNQKTALQSTKSSFGNEKKKKFLFKNFFF